MTVADVGYRIVQVWLRDGEAFSIPAPWHPAWHGAAHFIGHLEDVAWLETTDPTVWVRTRDVTRFTLVRS